VTFSWGDGERRDRNSISEFRGLWEIKSGGPRI
jgi:hypothetical protein